MPRSLSEVVEFKGRAIELGAGQRALISIEEIDDGQGTATKVVALQLEGLTRSDIFASIGDDGDAQIRVRIPAERTVELGLWLDATGMRIRTPHQQPNWPNSLGR